jgi:hypothetical protein
MANLITYIFGEQYEATKLLMLQFKLFGILTYTN